MDHQEQVVVCVCVCVCVTLLSCIGKTMTANAVANFLGKKVLLLTVSLLAERELTKVVSANHYFH